MVKKILGSALALSLLFVSVNPAKEDTKAEKPKKEGFFSRIKSKFKRTSSIVTKNTSFKKTGDMASFKKAADWLNGYLDGDFRKLGKSKDDTKLRQDVYIALLRFANFTGRKRFATDEYYNITIELLKSALEAGAVEKFVPKQVKKLKTLLTKKESELKDPDSRPANRLKKLKGKLSKGLKDAKTSVRKGAEKLKSKFKGKKKKEEPKETETKAVETKT